MADPLSIATWRNIFTKHGQKFGWGLAVLFGLPLVIGFGWSQYTGRNQEAASLAARDTVIATVNGDPITQGQFLALSRRAQQSQAGQQFAQQQGENLMTLVTQAVLQQEAKKRGIRASDADIDREIAQQRKGASDSDWENYLQSQLGLSADEYRDEVAKGLVYPALLESLKSEEKVSDEEIRNQTAEVKTHVVLISSGPPSPMMPPHPGQKPLTDAEAKKKAEDLLDQARKGADIAALARANSGDFTARKGGDLGWRPEYTGTFNYGKEFEDVLHKTAKGQFTPVVHVTGFQQGYVFAKVDDRHNNPPKGFDPKKTAEDLKTQRAQTKARDLILQDVKNANVVFNDPDKKAYYDLAKTQTMVQDQMMARFRPGSNANPPTDADVKKQQELVDSEFEAMQKRRPDDATVALVVAEAIKRKMNAKETTPAQKEQYRDRLIGLYESALKSTEDRNIRFDLAELYRDKKQYDQADKQYAFIARLLNTDQPFDAQGLQDDASTHQRLAAAFKSINKPDEAAKEDVKYKEMNAQAVIARKKEDEERKKQEAAQKASQAPPAGVTLPAGGSATVNKTIPVHSGTLGAPVAPQGKGTPANTPPAGKEPAATGGASAPAPKPGAGSTGH